MISFETEKGAAPTKIYSNQNANLDLRIFNEGDDIILAGNAFQG